MRNLDHRRGEDRGDAAVDRVAAGAHDPRAGVDGEGAARGDDAVRGAHLAAKAPGRRLGHEGNAGNYEEDRTCGPNDLTSRNHS